MQHTDLRTKYSMNKVSKNIHEWEHGQNILKYISKLFTNGIFIYLLKHSNVIFPACNVHPHKSFPCPYGYSFWVKYISWISKCKWLLQLGIFKINNKSKSNLTSWQHMNSISSQQLFWCNLFLSMTCIQKQHAALESTGQQQGKQNITVKR
jgi:hypothetical protein